MSGGWRNPFTQVAYGQKCSVCDAMRWATAGAVEVGGIHLCQKAIVDYLAYDPDNENYSQMDLMDVQLCGRIPKWLSTFGSTAA